MAKNHRGSARKTRPSVSNRPATSRSGRTSARKAPSVTYRPLSGPQAAVAALSLLAIGVWSYWPTLAFMVDQWLRKADYSHGFLVIPIALFFAWERKGSIPTESVRPASAGLGLLVLATVIRLIAGPLNMEFLDGYSIPLWVAGVVWTLFGLACLRWCLPSILFLFFMIPLPYSAEQWLSRPLQAIATRFSTAVLQMLGQPAIAEGNTIWIGEAQLEVEQACSGLRIFVAIIAMAFAFILFSRWSWWQKVLVLAAVPPVALTANAARIVGTGILYQYTDGDLAHRFSHDLSGWAMIPLAALMFWGFLVYLDRLFPEVVELDMSEVMRRAGS